MGGEGSTINRDQWRPRRSSVVSRPEHQLPIVRGPGVLQLAALQAENGSRFGEGLRFRIVFARLKSAYIALVRCSTYQKSQHFQVGLLQILRRHRHKRQFFVEGVKPLVRALVFMAVRFETGRGYPNGWDIGLGKQMAETCGKQT